MRNPDFFVPLLMLLPPTQLALVLRTNSDLRDKTYLFSHDVAAIPAQSMAILEEIRAEQNAPPLDVLRISTTMTGQSPKGSMPSATRYVNPMLQGQAPTFAHVVPAAPARTLPTYEATVPANAPTASGALVVDFGDDEDEDDQMDDGA